MIQPGEKWAARIDHAVNRCAVVLLLVSADFVHSDYCWGVEMKRALERHEAGSTIVIPIAVRRCDWAGAPFADLQALPKDAKPVNDWPKRDHAWTDVAKGIRAIVSAGSAASSPEAPPPRPPPAAKAPPPPPPKSKPGSEPPPRTPGTAFDTFLDALASEGGKQLAQHGVKGLMDALSGGGHSSESTGRAELVAEVLMYADHGRMGALLRSHEFPVPAKKADRARTVASQFEWDAGLVTTVYKAPQLRQVCDALELPVGLKGEMVQDLVDAVDEVNR
jgi:hypothetical protein